MHKGFLLFDTDLGITGQFRFRNIANTEISLIFWTLRGEYWRKVMKIRKLSIALVAFLMLSMAFLATAMACPVSNSGSTSNSGPTCAPCPTTDQCWWSSCWLRLPSCPVTLATLNQVSWQYPFQFQLSNVPKGCYAVSDGIYTGWCIDLSGTINREITYQVTLYSSCCPPTQFKSIPWDMINYILNHDKGANGVDISQAIWYFVNGGTWTGLSALLATYGYPSQVPTTCAQNLVNAALQYGKCWDPCQGSIVAVIVCMPGGQNCIIQVQNTCGCNWGCFRDQGCNWGCFRDQGCNWGCFRDQGCNWGCDGSQGDCK
jgi:hypothetical protein